MYLYAKNRLTKAALYVILYINLQAWLCKSMPFFYTRKQYYNIVQGTVAWFFYHVASAQIEFLLLVSRPICWSLTGKEQNLTQLPIMVKNTGGQCPPALRINIEMPRRLFCIIMHYYCISGWIAWRVWNWR